jgi:uncharacterized protein YutE (UPF0331/DUF86 family)
VPVNSEVVRSKLLDIEGAISRLQSWLPISIERLEQDDVLRWAVERGLDIAAEAVFAAGNHILAGEFQEAASEYRDIPPRLVARGVLASSTARAARQPRYLMAPAVRPET